MLRELKRAVVATSPYDNRGAMLGSVALLVAWAVLVAFGVHHHVFWRDEVRALTLALQASNILGVPAAVQGDAHPALWHVLLRAAHDLLGTAHVLSIVSVTVAAISIALLVWKAPFPLWTKAPFVLSGLSLYEYSVMARNYGISMLLMFVIASLMAKRPRNYWGIAVALFLLAQTNVTSAMLAPLYVLILISMRQTGSRRDRMGTLICTLAVVIGVFAAFATVYPTRNDMITEYFHGQDSIGRAILLMVVDPGLRFIHLIHFVGGESGAAIIATILLYGSAIGLMPDLVLVGCAIAAMWQTSLFYTMFYPSNGYRHEGLWIVFVISLYWIRTASGRPLLASSRDRGFTLRAVSLAAFGLLLGMNILFGAHQLSKFARQNLSMSRALGALISSDSELRNAILLPEPEQIGEALPYYVDNDMYLAREGKFGKAATWTRTSRQELSLHDLLVIAENLNRTTGKPILILTEPHLTSDGGVFMDAYSWRFSYTPAEFAELTTRASRLPLARTATDENFDVYLLR